MTFSELPRSAAWRHRDARDGFESVFLTVDTTGYTITGHTAAVEGDQVWAVRYLISVDEQWITKSAQIWSSSLTGEHEVQLHTDGSGRWDVDGAARPELDGCFDVDLEASACTNTLPVHRLQLGVGQSADAPATYVRALDLRVERLDQTYVRLDDHGVKHHYQYRAPVFDFETVIVYDAAGLVIEYPGIASRVL
jgi:hypothetical protein